MRGRTLVLGVILVVAPYVAIVTPHFEFGIADHMTTVETAAFDDIVVE